ncbi:hypothetical protein Q0812_10085 [Brevundimonas sp. 2R-24]|uniref:Uncharacterized protein n=1 Tax=Peiella sedimenti TaxID=3061083 RepID=A0ABT8SP95_9CAUL|nr:hypothetical protein [Caulobacteraceae bacterium XZ-24]
MPASKSRPDKPKPQLRVVGEPVDLGPEEPLPYALDRKPETVAERVKRLQAEARLLAKEELEGLQLALHEAARRAAEVAQGGEAYPVGAREIARQLEEDLKAKAASLKLLAARA